MKSLILILSIFLLPSNLIAEADFKNSHGDFFKLYNPDRTDIRIGFLHEMEAEEDGGPGKFDLNNSYSDFLVQMPLSKDAFFSLGGEFELRRYLFKPVDGAQTRVGSENLYGIDFSPGLGYFLTEDALVWAQATIGNYSDLEGGITDTEDYQLLGKGSFVFRINPGAQVVLGASYSNDYLEQRLLPFLGLRLMSDTGKFTLSLDLPFHIRAGYYISPEIEVFTQLIVSGDRYQANINGQNLKVGVHDERAGIGIRFWLFSKLSLTFEGGRTVGSELRFEDTNAGQFTTDDINPHWYGRTYLGWPL